MFIHSPNQLDRRSLTMLGLSAKPGSKNPIGMFGTGLKYSLAWLLRTETEFRLWLDGELQDFQLAARDFRGEEYQAILWNGEELPFTSNYAKNWSDWQVYRELVSNAMDEGGGRSDSRVNAPVLFEVPSFSRINHGDVFLSATKSLYKNQSMEIFAEPTEFIYYRGIRCTKAQPALPVTLNFICDVGLSEDRLMTSTWTARFELAIAISRDMPEAALRQVFRLPTEWFSYLGSIEDCKNEDLLRNAKASWIPPTVRDWLRGLAVENADYEEYLPRGLEKTIIDQALQIVALRGEVPSFRLVKNLPRNLKGLYDKHRNEIIISAANLTDGPIDLAATILEELFHRERGFADETREFQDFLIRELAWEISRRL